MITRFSKCQSEVSYDRAINAEIHCKELRRKTLPVNTGLFTALSIKDLRWIDDQLNIKTSCFTEYWCNVIAHFNVEVIEHFRPFQHFSQRILDSLSRLVRILASLLAVEQPQVPS